MIGKLISHYKVLEKLGEGGMGVVYKAQDTKLDRIVALKFLTHHVTTNESIKTRFMQEAKAASAINHPNVCVIHDIQEFNGLQFIVMEFVEGKTLQHVIQDEKISTDCVIEYAIQIAEALNAAHEKEIIHRDVKSENIMVTAKHHLKVMDFGLAKLKGSAKLTKTSSTLGTVAYMSPEQIKGQEIDSRSDIFSFGVVLYEMLTGKLPFNGDYEAAITYAIMNEDPDPAHNYCSNLSSELLQVLNRTLEKNINDRYQNMKDVLIDLKRLKRDSKQSSELENLAIGDEANSKVRRKRKTLLYTVVPSLAALLVLSSIFLLPQKSEKIDSIAVLPLENLSGDPEQDYFAAGMHEAVITELSKISALRTISRTSVMQYKGKEKSISAIAKELDVNGVVEGSALRSGNRVRITVQLIGIAPERHLWTQSFDRDLDDILSLHSQVAREIASAIKTKITTDEKARLGDKRPVNPMAYEAYLLGQLYIRKGGEENLWRAVKYCELAAEIDSTFAPAYAALALAYDDLGGNYNIISPDKSYPLMKKYAEKALSLDPNLSEAHSALGIVRQYSWDWIGAEREYITAMRLDPNSTDVLDFYSFYLLFNGQIDKAIELWEKWAKLDPMSTIPVYNSLYFSGRVDEAIRYLKNTISVHPDDANLYWRLATLYAREGRFQQAIEQLLIQIPLMSDPIVDEVALLGSLYGRLGHIEKAFERLQQLDDIAAEGLYVSPVLYAWIYAGLDDHEKAFELLEKGYENRAHRMGLGIISSYYVFEPIRDDLRFSELLRKMNLKPWFPTRI